MSMKDLLNKMTELQGTTKEEKVTTTGKKILNESAKPVVKESTKPSLKSMFNALLAEEAGVFKDDENSQIQQRLPKDGYDIIHTVKSKKGEKLGVLIFVFNNETYGYLDKKSGKVKYGYRSWNQAQNALIKLNDSLAEAEQVTIQPAKQNTQVIKQGQSSGIHPKIQKAIDRITEVAPDLHIDQKTTKDTVYFINDKTKEFVSLYYDPTNVVDVGWGLGEISKKGKISYWESGTDGLGEAVRILKSVAKRLSKRTAMNEAEQVTIQPAKQNTQVIKQGDKTLGTVTNPNLANQIKQSIGKGEMSLAGDDLQEDEKEDDSIVSYIKAMVDTFSAIDLDNPEEVYHDLVNFLDYEMSSVDTDSISLNDVKLALDKFKRDEGYTESKLTEKAKSKSQQQAAGAALAAKRGDSPKSTLKGASKEMAKMPTKELEKFAKTKHKGLPDKKQKTDEAAMPTHDGDFGAGLGAGRNSKTLEAKKAKPDFLDLDKDGNKKESMKKAAADKQKVSTMKKTNEAKAKPDYIDLDKDGNKKEPMKKAAADAKKKVAVKEDNKNALPKDIKAEEEKIQSAWLRKTSFTKSELANLKKREEDLEARKAEWRKSLKEGTNPTESARLLGKAHAMANDTFSCKYEEGSQEAQAYLDGYKSGLDECYGSGGGMEMQQDIGMMPGMDSMVSQDSMMDTPSPRGGSEFAFGGFDDVSDDDMMAFESWDRELNALLNEGKMKDIDIDMKQMSDAEFKKEHGKSKADMKKDLSGDTKKPVKEGISVSVSKGQQGSPDSVTVSAQDQDADALLAMIKQAGLGLFGGNEPSGYGSPVSASTQPVGDHDSMMNLIKKMSSTGNDYEDEESMSCDSCDDESDSKALVVGEEQGYDDKEDESLGMRTGKESDKEQSMKDRRDDSYGKFGKRTNEDETEDQMEFEVSEANAPDSGEAETTADENAEAKEDQALAGAMSGDEEEIDESEEELTEWANDAGYQGSENMKDNTFEQDIDFMTRVISGGLNGQKQDQTTLPHTKVKVAESSLLDDWKKLSGIK